MILELLPPAWVTVMQPPAGLLEALRQEGALLCASLCAKADKAIQVNNWTEAEALGRELQEVSWEGLHSGAAWREVTLTMRRAYAHSQFILAAAEIVQIQQGSCSNTATTHLKECMRLLDMSLLMGPPDIQEKANGLIDWTGHQLLEHQPQQPKPTLLSTTTTTTTTTRKRPRPSQPRNNEDESEDIPRLACPSLHAFLDQHMKPQVPVILTGCLDHWPAFTSWQDLNYLKRVAGQRVVPVEVGTGTYLTGEAEEGGEGEGEGEGWGGWGQQLMPLADFIEQYVVGRGPAAYGGEGEGEEKTTKNLVVSDDAAGAERETGGGGANTAGEEKNASAKKKGYLAQHKLFEQIPALKKDIYVPDYCALEVEEEGEGEGEEEDDGHVILHAWFGPRGTISPTHTDPYHNLLAQVVGSKAIRLFAPSESPYLYAHEGLMNNNSRVDPKQPDLARFPLFAQAKSQRCVLEPGEMLYVPPLWWHHIESLEVSFSVSFWWGRRRG